MMMPSLPGSVSRLLVVSMALWSVWASAVNARVSTADVTSGEIRYVPADHSLAVSFRSTPGQLELVLAAKFHRLTRLQSSKDIDALILQYLSEKFQILVDGKAVALQWVGKDVSSRWAWAYVDARLPETDVDSVTVKSSAWLELGRAHRLAMDVVIAGQKRVVTFSRGAETAVLALPSTAPVPVAAESKPDRPDED